MTASPLNIVLVDEDPVFRLGLRIWLEQRPEFTVIGEADTSTATLTSLARWQTAATTAATDAGAPERSPTVDIVILDVGLGQGDPEQIPGLQLCGEIKRQFPAIAVLVLSVHDEPVLRAAAQQMGADGFALRGWPVRDLARAIQQVARSSAVPLAAVEEEVAYPAPPEGPVAYLNRTSLAQIDAAMADIERQAAQRLPYWYRLVLAGKYRELRSARWLIQRILPVSSPPSRPAIPLETTAPSPEATPLPAPVAPAAVSRSARPAGGALAQSPSAIPIPVGDVRSRVCEAVFRKLQFPLDNRSEIPLEIDILREDKSRELLYTVLRAFETLLDDLQQAQIPPGQLPAATPTFLFDLWSTVLTDFFGRYYTPAQEGLEQPLVAVLQQDAAIVQTAILNPLPEVPALLAHLLFQTPLEIDGTPYVATTAEALRRSQYLLENLIIQVGCGVMQPVLNRYPDVESLKRSLYQRRIISTRDITRFRNDLSWRYRWDALVNEPKAIFESQYRLFALTPAGLRTHTIYAPRRAELDSLSGLQYAMTLALEARDAIAPRLRTAIAVVGSGVVFILTEVLGRGIGLIGRGIVKGVGSTWQDIRFRQRQRDEL